MSTLPKRVYRRFQGTGQAIDGVFPQPVRMTARVIYMATLIESLAVVTNGPELIAGSVPIFLNRNGRTSPSVVETIMAENIAAANAQISRIMPIGCCSAFSWSIAKQISPPMIPQARATSIAIRTSRAKTCENLSAARCPAAGPEATMAEVWRARGYSRGATGYCAGFAGMKFKPRGWRGETIVRQ